MTTFNETYIRRRDKTFFQGHQPLAGADIQNKHGGGLAILARNGVNFDVVNSIPTSKAETNRPESHYTSHLNIVLSGCTLLKDITEDMNLTLTHDNTSTHTSDGTNPSLQGFLAGRRSGIWDLTTIQLLGYSPILH